MEIYYVLGGSGEVVLPDHLHLLYSDLVPSLHGVQLMFQLLDVLLAVQFHLLHDLLLSVDLALQVLLLG